MPDGRRAGEPLSPGANPSLTAQSRADLLASLNSVAKLPYEWALDGISNTQTINPDALGHDAQKKAYRQPGTGYETATLIRALIT